MSATSALCRTAKGAGPNMPVPSPLLLAEERALGSAMPLEIGRLLSPPRFTTPDCDKQYDS
ncbi:uncharacterized protein PgNI_02410 [Pyricularia grisea]|uniref:Uncharacterized protein n=1 Tax=Pyricularia grisea TaxID=148305 RepID=A0A6P8BH10_PYRGI|nr:uncharacterized protein PgNI_02410 [Pyricularia grisea]TLD16156.1 hypothetical protein PgNI_02410 [Pyricularia grisea]